MQAITKSAHAAIATDPAARSWPGRVHLGAVSALDRLAFLAPLLGRLAVGLVFLSAGWGKVHALDAVTAFFIELHIPLPSLSAVAVAYSELICGGLLVLGLLTRLATLPLLVSMLVAVLTARIDEVSSVFDLVGLVEVTYLVMLAMILILGPGRVALDVWLRNRLWRGTEA